MKNKIVIQEVKGLIRSLKTKDIRSLHLGLDTRRTLILNELNRELEEVPEGRTAILNEQRLVIRALITPVTDIFARLEDDDLLQKDMQDYQGVLSQHLQNYMDFVPQEASDEKKVDTGDIFTRSRLDSADDTILIRRKGSKKNKMRLMKVKRGVAAHFDMILSDYDYNRTSLPPFRVQDGYAIIPKQKVIILDTSSLIRGSNQLQVVQNWVKDEITNGDSLKVIELPCSTENGLTYWWVMKTDDYAILFEEREINAWCPVTLEA